MTLIPPARVFSFETFDNQNPRQKPPGDRIDAQFHAHAEAIRSIQEVLTALVRDDGRLRDHSVTIPALSPAAADALGRSIRLALQPLADGAASSAAAVALDKSQIEKTLDQILTLAEKATSAAAVVSREAGSTFAKIQRAATIIQHAERQIAKEAEVAQKSLTVLYEGEGAAQDWAAASMAWAEHMPGTLPAGTIGQMDVTGDHYSSRWWANRAAAGYGAMTQFYLGAVSSPPTKMLDGSPIIPGAIYYDLTNFTPYVWTGAGWSPLWTPAKAVTVTLDYRATANQTLFRFTTPDLHGRTFSISPTAPQPVEAYKNGLRLIHNDGSAAGDYVYDSATSSITLVSPAALNDEITLDILSHPSSLAPGATSKYPLVDIDVTPGTGAPGYQDGTRTTFPLRLAASPSTPLAPAAPLELEVSLNGVIQQAGVDYSLSTSNIIFTVAPEIDAVVWINHLKTASAGVTEAPFDHILYGRLDGGWQAVPPPVTSLDCGTY